MPECNESFISKKDDDQLNRDRAVLRHCQLLNYIASNGRTDQVLERILEGRGCGLNDVLSRHLPGGNEEIHEQPQDNRCPSRDSNPPPPEYKSRQLPLA